MSGHLLNTNYSYRHTVEWYDRRFNTLTLKDFMFHADALAWIDLLKKSGITDYKLTSSRRNAPFQRS